MLYLFLDNKNIYLHFLSFHNTEMAQVFEVLPCERQTHLSCTVNTMAADARRRKEPGHQQS